MWLSNRNNPGILRFLGRNPARTAAGVLALALVLTLSACGGFRPLYGKAQGRPSAAAVSLAATQILPIEDRIGQQLHNNLLDLMNPRGRPAAPRYRLSVGLSTSTASTGLSKSAYATRAELRATASFTLVDVATAKTLLAGSRKIVTGYDILDSEYATLVSEQDAERRSARELAFAIQNQIAVFFLGRADGAGAK